MSWWNAKYKNDHGEYEITFASKDYEKTKVVEKVCQAIIDKRINTDNAADFVERIIKYPASLRPKGECKLEAHDERVNFRWNVTAECPECHHSKGEIWAGFFPGFPDYLANEIALQSAKSVKLDNYCPNCGADMRGTDNG